MSNIISDSVSKLSAITDQTPIDWDAFDSVLKGLEDINAYDEHDEETILSEFIMDAGAPVKYRTSGDDPNEEPECLLGSISWKISGAWMADKDYAWANIRSKVVGKS